MHSFVGVLNEISLISVRIIILNDFFFDFEHVLSLIQRPTILTLCWKSAKCCPKKFPKIKLQIEFERLEINFRSISNMHTKIDGDRRH